MAYNMHFAIKRLRWLDLLKIIRAVTQCVVVTDIRVDGMRRLRRSSPTYDARPVIAIVYNCVDIIPIETHPPDSENGTGHWTAILLSLMT
jgi:hypothetical protein